MPLRPLAESKPVFPPLKALEIGQDRIAEKSFAAELGGRTAPWAAVNSRDELDAAIAAIGLPAILKTCLLYTSTRVSTSLMLSFRWQP